MKNPRTHLGQQPRQKYKTEKRNFHLSSFLFIIALFLVLATPLHAQDYLGNDLDFFQSKTKVYQRWLDAKGLGQVLKVDKVELKKNGMELELFLLFEAADLDTAAALWSELQHSFNRTNPDQNLDDALLFTFYRMMEIPPAQGNVQIYIPAHDKYGYDICFYIWLWEENGRAKKEERINKCRGPQPLDIAVQAPRVKQVANAADVKIKGKEQAAEVFSHIMTYINKRFGQPNCDLRTPIIDLEKQSDYSLTFTVTDLCREVLTDSQISLWCSLVKRLWGPCNDMRRERLEFTFNYNSTDEGYQLTGFLTGKFGSGVYRPRVSGYMDMEPDFEEDFLKPYVRRFQQDLKIYLEKR